MCILHIGCATGHPQAVYYSQVAEYTQYQCKKHKISKRIFHRTEDQPQVAFMSQKKAEQIKSRTGIGSVCERHHLQLVESTLALQEEYEIFRLTQIS